MKEGLISPEEALGRVSGEGLARLMFPRFDTAATGKHPLRRPWSVVGAPRCLDLVKAA
ncbi:hypothetical protein SBD_0606 [Streptomyces bottropensis ATCC 25435]|uniref:Uncharacterized protein n=1 Tax=Streptomyces bottropensis ATCC 25435 TaxID=1054862 RepID=M3G044_9ACTN|nr:hypothetical protein SBD_0606 [Streptomyces bottropensis ATCC 25435]